MPTTPGRDRAAALHVLGLPADATPEQITRAYRRLARTTHPDITGATDPAAGDRFAALSDAYHRLAAVPSPRPVLAHKSDHVWPGSAVTASWARPPIAAGPVVVTPLSWTTAGRGPSYGS